MSFSAGERRQTQASAVDESPPKAFRPHTASAGRAAAPKRRVPMPSSRPPRGCSCATATAAPASTRWRTRPGYPPARSMSGSRTRRICWPPSSPGWWSATWRRVFATAELERMELRHALITIGETITGRACDPDAAALFRIVATEAQRFPALAAKMRGSTKARVDNAVANYFRSADSARQSRAVGSGASRGAVHADGLRRAARVPAVRLRRRNVETRLYGALEAGGRDFLERRRAARPVVCADRIP